MQPKMCFCRLKPLVSLECNLGQIPPRRCRPESRMRSSGSSISNATRSSSSSSNNSNSNNSNSRCFIPCLITPLNRLFLRKLMRHNTPAPACPLTAPCHPRLGGIHTPPPHRPTCKRHIPPTNSNRRLCLRMCHSHKCTAGLRKGGSTLACRGITPRHSTCTNMAHSQAQLEMRLECG